MKSSTVGVIQKYDSLAEASEALKKSRHKYSRIGAMPLWVEGVALHRCPVQYYYLYADGPEKWQSYLYCDNNRWVKSHMVNML